MSLTSTEGDFQFQAFRTSSQGVNEAPIGVRVIFMPTGELRECYKHNNYHDNKKEALEALKRLKK
jgi:protein subunit release factor A